MADDALKRRLKSSRLVGESLTQRPQRREGRPVLRLLCGLCV